MSVLPSRSLAEGSLVSEQLFAHVRKRRLADTLFALCGGVLVVLCLAVLVTLVGRMIIDGWPQLVGNFPAFFKNHPSYRPAKAGILSPMVGTCLVMLVTAVVALPVGIAAGIYLEEYAPRNRLTTIIEINISNLAGVPSIVWGLMALGVFIYGVENVFGIKQGFGRSILTAGLTLALMVLPIVIVATREAIRAIPRGIREASYACGASKLQTVRHHVLPYSLGGILTGCIIAMSRAVGETAPLVTIGALTFITFLPPYPGKELLTEEGTTRTAGLLEWVHSAYTVLPIQMYTWVRLAKAAFHVNAAATGVVLLVVTLAMNAVAIILRNRLRKRIQW